MSVNMTRTDLIRDALVRLVTENLSTVFVSPVDATTWASHPPAPWSRFGWRPAMIVSRGNEDVVSVPICPEIIAEQTNHLNDDQLRKYLTAMAFLMSHVAVKMATATELNEDVIQRIVWDAESALDVANPNAMRYITEICANTLQ